MYASVCAIRVAGSRDEFQLPSGRDWRSAFLPVSKQGSLRSGVKKESVVSTEGAEGSSLSRNTVPLPVGSLDMQEKRLAAL